jgi:hypothetical protein
VFALAGRAIGEANDNDVAGFAMGSGLSGVQVSGVQPTSAPLSAGFKSAFVGGPPGGAGGQQGIVSVLIR